MSGRVFEEIWQSELRAAVARQEQSKAGDEAGASDSRRWPRSGAEGEQVESGTGGAAAAGEQGGAGL
jgi:hypothetical protein